MREAVKQSKADQTWVRFMKVGARTGCHQMPERSFFFKGYQFPVCARCLGVFIGYLTAPFFYIKAGWNHLKYFAWAGMLIMLVDWLLQAVHIKASTNVRRLVTGIAGGFGSMIIFLKLLGSLLHLIKNGMKKKI